MGEFCGDELYVQNSIAYSRIFQEGFSIGEGISGYGVLAAMIDLHIEQIDAMAEYLGRYISDHLIEKKYASQYGSNPLLGINRRNAANGQKAYENQVARRNTGAVADIAIEGGIKIGSRFIQKWASEKEKYQCFEQAYRILLAYANEDAESVDMTRTKKELNKIRNSFPLSSKDRLKLSDISTTNLDVFETDFPILQARDNQELKENLSYLLYVLYVQKYGDSSEKEGHLLEYYDFFGYSSLEAKDLLREHKNSYDIIASDQTKYLKIARAMVKEFEPKVFQFKPREIAARVNSMAAYDPYCIRKRRVKGHVEPGKKRFSDIFFESPMLVLHAGATALSQINLDNNEKENARKQMREWGLDIDSIDTMMNQSEDIKKESQGNEYF